MNKKLTILSVSGLLLVSPAVILAVNLVPLPGSGVTNINAVVDAIFNVIWPIFAAFAVVMFIIAGVQFLSAQGEPSKISQARQSLIWGAVGMAVGLLAFSIPFIIDSALGT